MNKTKRGFLTVSSVITIILSIFAILLSVIMFFIVGEFDANSMKQEYLNDKSLTYYEKANGDYYFTGMVEDEEIIIYKKDVEEISKFMQTFINTFAVIVLVQSLIKIVFAVRILLYNSREKYPSGSVVTLLVLSLLEFNFSVTNLLP